MARPNSAVAMRVERALAARATSNSEMPRVPPASATTRTMPISEAVKPRMKSWKDSRSGDQTKSATARCSPRKGSM